MVEHLIQSSLKGEIEPIIIKDQCFEQDIWTMDFTDYVTQSVHSEIEDPLRLFYDELSQRHFKATLSHVVQAEYHLNRNYTLGQEVTANEWYAFLGLDTIEGDDDKMWYPEDGVYWIDFNHKLGHTSTGEEVIIIQLPYAPYNNHEDAE